ncbi:BREX-1 system adenine-specific DNA-methyltransferase PglX [Bacillus inaquosorum]|uniref:BREX-1 system adenine-specific DNA-methyltransferase PglX n=1 Tax=Bacillus inaquosorum TaxID=483913 RepID=UPI00227EB45E|nr:BREX-1 system adenine-specific DNA-methyltransferase PglX [Bacillus inaquosorum]MCY8055652.1 BREX-1 system adenine-specific DNA-methyltransferase PglX [Bacillus inaquosorum]MCY9407849.1 BREX-1 system adenine-specific DNA-methyltransferase PglX [Bacillus inaquosorum]MCY9415525.1 BREX-1 system adenine-specific DNA-methyltransferase PglX [Bacillus inaquosorum]
MNKTELKNFAIQSRRQLIDQVKTKALMYGIDEKNDLEIQEQFGQIMINDKPYPLYMRPAFNSLKSQLKQKGYKQLVEEVAYTWFNRIIAIRYMEVHDYLPEKVNVLSSSVGRVDPDILFEYETMDLPVKQEEIRELLHAGDTESAYRKLFIAQCNALNSILPFLFEQIQDYTELLLPDFLLDAESVIKVLVQNDELMNSFDEIEVIGWLYQYYIAEEKDRVFAQKSKYKKEEIPFATQLFTPKWIVQYMVQNSLGRYWTEAHREDEDLISNWEYFIKHEEEDFYENIAPYVNKELRVEDIKLLDPAMGSGHILVYAFEVFHQIYEKCGYPEREIPRLIIENNLYGLDIDDRAYQLAAFAVVMKASSYSRRFLRSVEREGIQLNLASIQETNHISDSVIAYIAQEEKGERYNQVKAFFDQYENAKTYGSLINITERNLTFIEERLEHIQNNPVEDLFFAEQHDFAKEVIPNLIQQTKIMRNEFDVVVMNPPYMGSGNMSKELSDFLKKYYPNSKADLFAAFMDATQYKSNQGFCTSITQQSWMFILSYEKLREKLLNETTIDSLLHLGRGMFGADFGTVAFVLRNYKVQEILGIYKNFIDKKGEVDSISKKEKKFFERHRDVIVPQDNFFKIPGRILAYWASEKMVNHFKNELISDEIVTREGMATANNDLFLRNWFEVSMSNICFTAENNIVAKESKCKWFPYNKGGAYRKWYGNNDLVVNWENDGYLIRNNKDEKTGRIRSHNYNGEYAFREGITWTSLSSSKLSVRYSPVGYLFDSKGAKAFTKFNNTEILFFVLGLLNSKVAEEYLSFLSPTIDFKVGDLLLIPLVNKKLEEVVDIVKTNIQISKHDWNSYETSWDFKKHPLLLYSKPYIKNAFEYWTEHREEQFNLLKSNEEKLNSIFINIYNLDQELSPEVDEKDITIRKADLAYDVKTFLHFYIGCVTGRYSLSTEGLVYTGGKWDDSNYVLFKPNKNGIIQFTESAYFKEDIILRLREFLSIAYSSNTVDENMQWIAEALIMKKGENAENRLRRYFLDEFFEDHCKMYQKCPIYWLLDSGKQKGLRTLIYMHRYQTDTMATIRFEQLQEMQSKYQNEITDIENRLVNPNLSASEKKKLTTEKTSFEKKMDELREFDIRLAEIANEEIEIDLDDGVKVNYEKFYRAGKGVLAKIK